jgi:hypothetical protein
MFLILIALISTALTGCATAPEWIRNDPYDYKIQTTFNADFETTWSAIIRALEAHPITTIEKASGILLTDWVQGNSPLYLRKIFVPILQRETKRAAGIYLAQLTPNIVYVAYALEDAPAYQAGMRSLDIVLDINGEVVTKVADFSRIMGASDQIIVRVNRYGKDQPLTFTIVPQEINFSHSYIPVATKYKLNVRVSKIAEDKTEVKVINYEEGDFGYADQYGWHANYQAIPTATLREKYILDQIQAEIVNVKE